MTNEPTKPSVLEVLLLVQSDRAVGHLSDYTQNALAAAVNALTKPAVEPVCTDHHPSDVRADCPTCPMMICPGATPEEPACVPIGLWCQIHEVEFQADSEGE